MTTDQPPRGSLLLTLAAAFGLALAGLGGLGTLAVFRGRDSEPPITATPRTWTILHASADTYLGAGLPNHAWGATSFLRIQAIGANRVLVRFDPTEMSDAAAGRTLHTARLRLYIEANSDNWGGTGRTVDAHRVTAAWTESGATWNCPHDADTGNDGLDCPVQWSGGRFSASATATALHTNGQSGWVEWDVTADVIDMLASPPANHGWLAKKTEEDQAGLVTYASREGKANVPELLLMFESAATPTPP